MSTILTALFKSSVGLLVTKARKKTAEKLKNGDLTDESFRTMIVNELEDIKGKLDGLARKDLLASVEFLKQGIVNMNKVFEKTLVDKSVKRSAVASNEELAVLSQADSFLTKTKDLLPNLNESAKMSLADAKERFKSARMKATDAFSNEALPLSDRVLALKVQLTATILERVDRPADAVEECKLCLENLHAMPAIRDVFKVQLTGGVKSIVFKEERKVIFVDVCQANHVVFRLIQMANPEIVAYKDHVKLPLLDLGERIDILRDERVIKKLVKLDMPELCNGYWSFNIRGENQSESEMVRPESITVNVRDEFVVLGIGSNHQWMVNIYDPCGKFLYSTSPSNAALGLASRVATDRHANVYVMEGHITKKPELVVKTAVHKFQVGYYKQWFKPHFIESFRGEDIAINKNDRVFVVGIAFPREVPEVKARLMDDWIGDRSKQLLPSFGNEHLQRPCGMITASHGHVLVLDCPDDVPPSVHTFSQSGSHLQQFQVRANFHRSSIAFDRRHGQVVTMFAVRGPGITRSVYIYTEDGECLRDFFSVPWSYGARGLAVTTSGHLVTTNGEGDVCIVNKS